MGGYKYNGLMKRQCFGGIFMADTLLIIGNGFDVSLGLKTRYSDFLNSTQFLSLHNNNNSIALHLNEKHESGNWVDIEVELASFSSSLIHDNRIPKVEFSKHYSLLVNAIKEYLNSLDYSLIDKNSHAYKLIDNLTKQSAHLKIINFNYTNTIKAIIDACHDPNVTRCSPNIINIHGSLHDQIVFGIEDNAYFYRDQHSFLLKSYYVDSGTLQQAEIPPVTDNYDIHIFGCSLGVSDYMYFSDFFKNAAIQNISTITMYLYYYGENSRDELYSRLLCLTEQNITHFKKVINLKEIDVSIPD
jgi:hypothetical protein